VKTFIPKAEWASLEADDLALIREVMDRREMMAQLPVAKELRIRNASMGKNQGQDLYRFIKTHEAQQLFEIGTCVGVGAMYMMAAAGPNCAYVGMEGVDAKHSLAIAHMNEMFPCYDHTIELGDFKDTFSRALERAIPLEFVYLDGDHKSQPTATRFDAIVARMDAGFVLVDDLGQMPGCQSLLDANPRATRRCRIGQALLYEVVQ